MFPCQLCTQCMLTNKHDTLMFCSGSISIVLLIHSFAGLMDGHPPKPPTAAPPTPGEQPMRKRDVVSYDCHSLRLFFQFINAFLQLYGYWMSACRYFGFGEKKPASQVRLLFLLPLLSTQIILRSNR